MEKPVTFTSNGEQIVGMLHMPRSRAGHAPAVVFLHGFTGNKTECQRLFVQQARALAAAGIAVLRFDFRGSGDSEGEFSQMTLSREIEDAKAAMQFIRRVPGVDRKRIGVLGFSMGGVVASNVLGCDRGIRAAVLWAAVSRPDLLVKGRMTPEAGRQLKDLGVIDYGGFAIGPGFLKDVGRHKPLREIGRTNAAVLILHGEKDETVPPSASSAFEKALKKSRKAVVKYVIPEAGHTFNRLSWSAELMGMTLAWFRINLQ